MRQERRPSKGDLYTARPQHRGCKRSPKTGGYIVHCMLAVRMGRKTKTCRQQQTRNGLSRAKIGAFVDATDKRRRSPLVATEDEETKC